MAKITFQQEATASKWQISLALASECISKVGEQVALCIVNILMFIFMRNPVMAALWAVTFPHAYADWFSKDQTTRSISGWVIKCLGWKIRQWFVKAKPDYFAATDQLRAWLVEYGKTEMIEKFCQRTLSSENLELLLKKAEDNEEIKRIMLNYTLIHGLSNKILRSYNGGLKETLKKLSAIYNQRLLINRLQNESENFKKLCQYGILPEAQSHMNDKQYLIFVGAGKHLHKIAVEEYLYGGADPMTAMIFKHEPREIFDDPEIREIINNDKGLLRQYVENK